MKIFNSPKAAFAMLLTAILLFSSVYAPSSKADTTYTARTANVLIVYDDSLESYYYSHAGITDAEHRFEQMTRLASIPFLKTMNLTLNFTIVDYSTAFGEEEFSKLCPSLYNANNQPPWNHNASCQHVNSTNFMDCATVHHTSSNHILALANALAQSTSNSYDIVCVFVAHKLCYLWGTTHGYCGGIAYNYGFNNDAFSFVSTGHSDFNTNTSDQYQVQNLLSLKGKFLHEISHVFNLSHASNSPYSCTTDKPCVMRSSFDGIIYHNNAWCDACQAKINTDLGLRFDSNEGGA